MALTTNTTVWKILATIFVALTALVVLFFYFETISITIVLGFVIIILSEKMLSDYSKRMNNYGFSAKRKRLFGYVLVLFWLVVGVLILSNSINDISAIVSANLGNQGVATAYYVDTIKPHVPEILQERLTTETTIRSIENWFASLFSSIISNVGFIIFNGILIIPLMLHMYFRRRHIIYKRITEALPQKFHDGFMRAARKIGTQLHDFTQAKVIESTVIGGICCFGFFVAGLKGWLVLGVFAGFLNVVPYVGPIVGAIPALLVGLLDAPVVALYVLITVAIAQLIDNFYLIPFMISQKVKMDALLSIIVILIGAQLFGLMGMIFAIPIYLIYNIVLSETYKELVKLYETKNK